MKYYLRCKQVISECDEEVEAVVVDIHCGSLTHYRIIRAIFPEAGIALERPS